MNNSARRYLFTIYLPDISFCSLFFNIFIEKLTRCPADNVDVTFSMSSFLFFFFFEKRRTNNRIDKCKNFFKYKIDCCRGLVHFIDRILSKIDAVGRLFKKKNWKKYSAAPWSSGSSLTEILLFSSEIFLFKSLI